MPIEAVEILFQLTLVFRSRQILIPVTHAAKIKRVTAEKQTMYLVLLDEAQDGAECSLVELRIVDVIEADPQFRFVIGQEDSFGKAQMGGKKVVTARLGAVRKHCDAERLIRRVNPNALH